MLRATRVGVEAGVKKSLDVTLLGTLKVTSWSTTLLDVTLFGVGSRKKKPRPSLEGNCTSVNRASCTMALRGMSSGMGKESTARKSE